MTSGQFTFPKAILFDWDNTLVDTWDIIHQALAHVFVTRDMTPWTREEVKNRCHISAREAFPILFKDDSMAALADFYNFISNHHLEHLSFLPGALEVLQKLANHNIPLGLVSNKRRDILLKETQHLNVQSLFSSIVASGDALYDKPHPAPLLLALEEMDLSPSTQIWYLGDAPTDWQASQAAGLLPIKIQENASENQITDCQFSLLTSCPSVFEFFNSFSQAFWMQKTASTA